MMQRTSLTMLCLSLSLSLSAQKISLKKVEVAGEKVIVHYDLEDSNPNHEYQIHLFSSTNNYTTALTRVKGDVGDEVKAGLDRKIEWNIREELGPYRGKVAVEVKGKVYVPFVKLQNFNTSKKYKRGKIYPIQWRPGSNNPIHIELYKGAERVSGELNHPNNGSYSLYIPAKAKPGSEYRLKITDSKNAQEVVYSGNFKVTHKIPLLLKVVPVAALAGVAAVLASSGGGGGEGGGTTNPEEIPVPVFPGGN